MTGAARIELPRDAWQELAQESDEAAFHDAWLACLMPALAGAAEAVVVMGAANTGPFRPVAFWPPGLPVSEPLAAACEQTLALRTPLRKPGPRAVLALPVVHDSDVHGVVAVAFGSSVIPPQALDWLRWGAGWLLMHSRRGEEEARRLLRERLLVALELTMTALDEPRAMSACQAAVTAAAVRLECDRVAIGFHDGRAVRLVSLSHSAEFSRRIDLVHTLEAVMNEAADQGSALYTVQGAVTGEAAQAYLAVREQAQLSRQFGNASVLSAPFMSGPGQSGVLVFEWPLAEVGAAQRELAESLAPILGRVLLEKRYNDRPLLTRLRDGARGLAARLLGPRHVKTKLTALLLAAAAVFFTVAHGDFRVAANARLEGAVQRVVVAPFDGFVASAQARAGQVVQAGDVLATLDERDLQLEAARWESQQVQYSKQLHSAQAEHNLAQIQITQAQTDQAAAQRALSEAMLERTRITAPLTGVIISGDLSQRLGSAVRKGQTLFELAPLDAFRIVLEADEADVAHIAAGQRGELVLTALPGQSFAFTVTLVTSVAHAREGQNTFRVEALLDEPASALRPGMEGLGRISVEERRLLWIWTRGFTGWLRLKAWAWLGL
jgi:RND family efflux transporter MFP subunit